jgi:hypothetical protein
MDSPDRNRKYMLCDPPLANCPIEDTPPKAKSAGGPPPASAAYSKAKRDQRAQMSASIWALRGGQIPELPSQDPSMAIEREKSDSRRALTRLPFKWRSPIPLAVPLKRDRSWDFFDSPVSRISGRFEVAFIIHTFILVPRQSAERRIQMERRNRRENVAWSSPPFLGFR